MDNAIYVSSSGDTSTILTANTFGKCGLKRLSVTRKVLVISDNSDKGYRLETEVKESNPIPYDTFKRIGIKTPVNWGKAMYDSMLNVLKNRYPKSWETKIKEISDMFESGSYINVLNSRGKTVTIKPGEFRGGNIVTFRKGYRHQAIKG